MNNRWVDEYFKAWRMMKREGERERERKKDRERDKMIGAWSNP